jgi:predicted ester cyclase
VSTAQTTRNKTIYKRLCDVVNTGDVTLISTVIDEVFEPDVRNSTPLPVEGTGREALKQVWTILLRAFPDLHVTIEDLVAEEDKVAVMNTVTGTQTGPYMGHPPTGERVTYTEMFILRFAGDRVAATSGVVDVLAQMRQLGIAPAR